MQERPRAARVGVNLLAAEGARHVRAEGKELRVGALATLADLAASPDARRGWAALAEAAAGAATPQVRNVATVGGNLCQRPRCWYFRSPDFLCLKKGGEKCFAVEGENQYHAIFGAQACGIVHPSSLGPALVAFGARLRVVSPAGERELGIEEFFAVPDDEVRAENVLGPQDLIVEVAVPAGRDRSATLEVRERQSCDWPLAMVTVAGALAGGKIADLRICLGAVAPRPWRLPKVEDLVRGQAPSDKLFREAGERATDGSQPMSQNAYKVQLVRALVHRALSQAFAV